MALHTWVPSGGSTATMALPMLRASSNPVIPPPVQSSFGQIPELDPHIRVLQTIPFGLGLISTYCQHSWGDGVGSWVRSDLLLVRHYILFITHAVWIAGPGALELMIYMFLYCTSCYVILTSVSCILTIIFFDTTDTASPSTVALSTCHTAHFYMVFT